MKKIILPFVAGLLALAATAPCAHAQSQKDADTYAKTEKPEDATVGNYRVADGASSSALELKNVNKKALKEFARAFNNPGTVQWYKDDYGFMAYFTINGIKNRSNYDKRGNWLYSIRNYGEKQLPTDIRGRVKRVYYDFTIMGVQEILIEDKTVYLIHMRDDTVYQTVRIAEDEMDVIASYHQ
jgi:hypothetical protein